MTNKIPPRPEYPDAQESPKGAVAEYWKQRRLHTEAVAKIAVEALRKQRCECFHAYAGDLDQLKGTLPCPRCEALRQIEESGWQP